MIEVKVLLEEKYYGVNLTLCDKVKIEPVKQTEERLATAVTNGIIATYERFDANDVSDDACDCACCDCAYLPIDESNNTTRPHTPFPWRPIETIPATGDFLLAIATDDGWTYSVLPRDKKGNFSHEGEPTFKHSYYFEPRFWAECPPPPTEEQAAADASDS